ncbi:MAG: PIN domain-containing protein [Anaerolineae bacterium]|nr:PIN domain-containing protein [Anaerolineae bacterium]HNS40814.1 PIN domain-containing protein [Promineifilum sp.]
MNVLVDTSVWSLAFRRSSVPDEPAIQALRTLIEQSRAQLIGPIRQEILSGIREQAQYEALRDTLRSFPDLAVATADYERAAELFNLCRRQGLQGSNTDFLICAVAERLELSILTTDHDFQQFQAHIPVSLYAIGDANDS